MECAATPELLTAIDEPAARFDDFDLIVRLYRPKIFRFVLASLREQDAAETLTQDCFLRAYNYRDHFRSECSVNTWLMQIAVNLVRDHVKNRRLQFWRRTQRKGRPVQEIINLVPTGQQSSEEIALLQERVREVWSVADSLSEKQREVFLLRFVEDMDLPEIADATGMKLGTVKTHLFRGLQIVRERIAAKA